MSEPTLPPFPALPQPADATGPVGPNLFQPIRIFEYGAWLGAPEELLGEAGWSLPARAEGHGLDLGTLSIEAAPENPDRSGIALTGELNLFSKSAQQPGTTEHGDNRDWSRETSPAPADAMRGAFWVIPLVFLLIFWLLLGYERGGRRRRSSSRRVFEPPPQPSRRTSRRRRR